MLSAKSSISDSRLEPTDDTVMTISIRNDDRVCKAEDVRATVCLKGGDQPGIRLSPDDRYFGDIGPCQTVTKEFVINTERAAPNKSHEVALVLKYHVARTNEELETVKFEVAAD